MNKKYAFLIDPVLKGTETTERSGSVAKSFSLTIRADDGCTLLQTRVEFLHQAFQKLIDWSIEEIGQDVCAASRDFGWIEREEKFVQLRR